VNLFIALTGLSALCQPFISKWVYVKV